MQSKRNLSLSEALQGLLIPNLISIVTEYDRPAHIQLLEVLPEDSRLDDNKSDFTSDVPKEPQIKYICIRGINLDLSYRCTLADRFEILVLKENKQVEKVQITQCIESLERANGVLEIRGYLQKDLSITFIQEDIPRNYTLHLGNQKGYEVFYVFDSLPILNEYGLEYETNREAISHSNNPVYFGYYNESIRVAVESRNVNVLKETLKKISPECKDVGILCLKEVIDGPSYRDSMLRYILKQEEIHIDVNSQIRWATAGACKLNGTPILKAACKGNVNAVQLLLEHKADVSALCDDGRGILQCLDDARRDFDWRVERRYIVNNMVLVKFNWSELVKLLLERGVTTVMGDMFLRTPLEYCGRRSSELTNSQEIASFYTAISNAFVKNKSFIKNCIRSYISTPNGYLIELHETITNSVRHAMVMSLFYYLNAIPKDKRQGLPTIISSASSVISTTRRQMFHPDYANENNYVANLSLAGNTITLRLLKNYQDNSNAQGFIEEQFKLLNIKKIARMTFPAPSAANFDDEDYPVIFEFKGSPVEELETALLSFNQVNRSSIILDKSNSSKPPSLKFSRQACEGIPDPGCYESKAEPSTPKIFAIQAFLNEFDYETPEAKVAANNLAKRAACLKDYPWSLFNPLPKSRMEDCMSLFLRMLPNIVRKNSQVVDVTPASSFSTTTSSKLGIS